MYRMAAMKTSPLRFERGRDYSKITIARATRQSEDGDIDYLDSWELITSGYGCQPGQDQIVRRISSRVVAMRAYHDHILALQSEGFTPIVDGLAVGRPGEVTFVERPALEAAIDDDPTDAASWDVLADAWAQAHDPRGECMLLARANQQVKDPAEFLANKRAADGARRVRDAELFGALGSDGYRIRPTYVRGMLDRVEVRDEQCAPGRPTRELLATLLAHPLARFLRELVLIDVDPSERIITTHPHLRSLAIRFYRPYDDTNAEEWNLASKPADLSNLDDLPRLEHLDLFIPTLHWPTLALPRLTALDIQACFELDDLQRMVAWASNHPRLERIKGYSHCRLLTQDPHIQTCIDDWLAAPRGPRLQSLEWDGRTQ